MDDPKIQISPKTKRARKPQLKVVFDTNALYVTPTSLGSASDLLRDEIATLIVDSKYPDLDILWYLPEVVRHERQYQMQTEALKLRGPRNRIEKLLGHNLALTDKTLLDHVKAKIDEKEKELGLEEIVLEHSAINWPALIQAALYRKPPFQAGEKEKGFRDALVAESFVQLLGRSPKQPQFCRVVLVTSDTLLAEAVKERTADHQNVNVLAGVEELKGIINTLISNVGEDFIELLKPKAAKLFFVSGEDKETLYFTEKVGERIREKFKDDLDKKPEGTTFRTNKIWYINRPNFLRKESRRVFWTSRIEVEIEAGISVESQPQLSNLAALSSLKFASEVSETQGVKATILGQPMTPSTQYAIGANPGSNWWPNFINLPDTEKTVVTQKGRDIYEVLWSVEVTTTKGLKRTEINEIKHIGLKTVPASHT
jgi:hypothetical protein